MWVLSVIRSVMWINFFLTIFVIFIPRVWRRRPRVVERYIIAPPLAMKVNKKLVKMNRYIRGLWFNFLTLRTTIMDHGTIGVLFCMVAITPVFIGAFILATGRKIASVLG